MASSNPSGRVIVVLLLVLVTAGACQTSTSTSMSDRQKQEVEEEVRAASWEFHAADTSRNAQALIDLLWPDFTLLADGMRSNYDEVATGSREFMAQVDSFQTVWSDLEVVVLSPTSAVTSFIFKDRIVMRSGEVLESWGPNTFIWLKRDNDWHVIHTDADHYVLSDSQQQDDQSHSPTPSCLLRTDRLSSPANMGMKPLTDGTGFSSCRQKVSQS